MLSSKPRWLTWRCKTASQTPLRHTACSFPRTCCPALISAYSVRPPAGSTHIPVQAQVRNIVHYLRAHGEQHEPEADTIDGGARCAVRVDIDCSEQYVQREEDGESGKGVREVVADLEQSAGAQLVQPGKGEKGGNKRGQGGPGWACRAARSPKTAQWGSRPT